MNTFFLRESLCKTTGILLAFKGRELPLFNGRFNRYILQLIPMYIMINQIGGFPERFFTNQDPEHLWKVLTKEDILVCAGTPEIKNAAKIGLYGGHAYTISMAFEDSHQGIPRLLRVRNPWGKATKEWNGDWSKNSNKLKR